MLERGSFFQLFDKSVLLVNFFYCVLEIKQTKATSSIGPPEAHTVTLFLRIDTGRYDNIPREEGYAVSPIATKLKMKLTFYKIHGQVFRR